MEFTVRYALVYFGTDEAEGRTGRRATTGTSCLCRYLLASGAVAAALAI